ncbi:MAG: hypothetical protein LBT48_04440 [Prevotellaceae bacterium]|jgi:hypothetical protein|nr:hypothetical protein [Prevotellaceae bacterium]
MKKILSIITVASLMAACCGKPQPVGISVETFLKAPKTFVGLDTTLSGTIRGVCDTSTFKLGAAEGCDKLFVVVNLPCGKKACPKCVGKAVLVKGTIKEVVVDSAYVAALESELLVAPENLQRGGTWADVQKICNKAKGDSSATKACKADSAACCYKICKEKRIADLKEKIAANGAFTMYAIDAKCVKPQCDKESSCKDGEKKCCKKDGEKKECRGEKDGDKKECCKKHDDKKCCKDTTKKACDKKE